LFEKLLIERERHPSWVSFALSSFPVSFRFSVYLQFDQGCRRAALILFYAVFSIDLL